MAGSCPLRARKKYPVVLMRENLLQFSNVFIHFSKNQMALEKCKDDDTRIKRHTAGKLILAKTYFNKKLSFHFD